MSSNKNDDRPLPSEGLLTSQDLFGDLVDAPSAPPQAPPARAYRGPIRVQVSEPGSPRTGPFEPGQKHEPLAQEVAALLDALPDGEEVRPDQRLPQLRADAAAGTPLVVEVVAEESEPGSAVEVSVEPEPLETLGPPPVAALSDPEREAVLDALALTLDRPRFPPPRLKPPAAPIVPSAFTLEAALAAEAVAPVEPPTGPLAEAGDPTASSPGALEASPDLTLPSFSASGASEPERPGGATLNPQDVDHLLGVMGSLRAAPRLEARYSAAGEPLPATSSLESHSIEPAQGEPAPLDLGALAQDAFAGVSEGVADPKGSEARASGGTLESGGLAEGEAIYGPYRLLERVAVGGMAEVFRAKRSGVEGFEKVLAVKRILPHLSDNKEFVDMFIDEAKMVAGLSHPNIVQIFDLGRLDKSYYIAMEYVHGRDLRTILRRGKERGLRVPLDLSVLVVSKICAALDYAHRRKDDRGRPLQIVHRDISPQNILISFDGDVKLTDFGIAKAASKASVTDHGALRGKLLYMSPEQAGGRAMDRRSDIFSLGIVFYEMIADQKPFLGTSEMSILETVRECRVSPPTQLNPRIPEKLERVVMKALSRDPEQRYQDGADMHRDLERVLHERQAPTVAELARFMEILFEPEERGDAAADEAALADARPDPEGGLEMEFEATPREEPPAAEPPPAKDGRSLHRLLKKFGIR
jgi:Protein kinase domain